MPAVLQRRLSLSYLLRCEPDEHTSDLHHRHASSHSVESKLLRRAGSNVLAISPEIARLGFAFAVFRRGNWMERLSTVGLPAVGRVAAWNDLYSSRMSRVEFTPADQHRFDAELSIGQLGYLKLAKLSVDRCSIERGNRHLLYSPRLYSFLLQTKGSSVFSHYGHEAHLSEGDFVLCDTGMPHYFQTDDTSVTIMVRVLPETLREYLPTPEQFCGLRLGRAVGLTATAAAMVQSLSDHVDFGPCPDYEGSVARYLLEMISFSYTMGFDCRPKTSTVVGRRSHDVIRYIEDHLREPSMTVASVANGVHLSPRYLRTIFSASGEKVFDYILRRRLDECARQIRNPSWRDHTLIEIALSWGFNSAAHFTRSFRAQFGVSPREYRRSMLD
jgi:AraC-like DNA-binding protein